MEDEVRSPKAVNPSKVGWEEDGDLGQAQSRSQARASGRCCRVPGSGGGIHVCDRYLYLFCCCGTVGFPGLAGGPWDKI